MGFSQGWRACQRRRHALRRGGLNSSMLSHLARLKTFHYAALSTDTAQLVKGSWLLLCWTEEFGVRNLWERFFTTHTKTHDTQEQHRRTNTPNKSSSFHRQCLLEVNPPHRDVIWCKHTRTEHTKHVHTEWHLMDNSWFSHLFHCARSIWLCTNSPTHTQG